MQQAYDAFREMITYYGVCGLMAVAEQYDYDGLQQLLASAAHTRRKNWLNVGGQLIPTEEVESAKRNIKEGTLNSWRMCIIFIQRKANLYPEQKILHQLASLSEIKQTPLNEWQYEAIHMLLEDAVVIKEKIAAAIYTSTG